MHRHEIATVLASAGLRPKHKYGQNFMVDLNTLQRIVDAGQIGPGDVVLEIGPGVGNLTCLLAQRAAAVLAVDIDSKLLEAARQYHRAHANIEWLHADALAGKHEINGLVIDRLRQFHASHPTGPVRLISNLPYNAASPLIAELLVFMWRENQSPVSEAGQSLLFAGLTFTVQLEVAHRMAATHNTTDYGPLGILIQLLADVKILGKIPPGAFWPPPKVQSALVHIVPSPGKMARVADALQLQQLLSGIFSHRRQRLSNALKHHLGERFGPEITARLTAAGIDSSLRPEALRLDQFLTLAGIVNEQ